MITSIARFYLQSERGYPQGAALGARPEGVLPTLADIKHRAGLSWTFVVALMLSSAACTGSADSSEPTPASSTSTPTLLQQVVADYNVRNNAAIAAAEHYDSSLWKTAHMGAVLESDLYQTGYNEVFNKPGRTNHALSADPTVRHGPRRLSEMGGWRVRCAARPLDPIVRIVRYGFALGAVLRSGCQGRRLRTGH